MSRNVKVSNAVAEHQARAMAPMLEGATLRIYDGDRPDSPEAPAGGAKLLVDLMFPDATRIRVEGGKIIAGPLLEAHAIASGRPRWYRIVAAGQPHVAILDGDCGEAGSGSACQVAHARIDEGQPCRCSLYVHDVRGEDE